MIMERFTYIVVHWLTSHGDVHYIIILLGDCPCVGLRWNSSFRNVGSMIFLKFFSAREL